MPPPSGFSTLAFARLVFRDARSDALSAARGDGKVRRRDAAGGGAQSRAGSRVRGGGWSGMRIARAPHTELVSKLGKSSAVVGMALSLDECASARVLLLRPACRYARV